VCLSVGMGPQRAYEKRQAYDECIREAERACARSQLVAWSSPPKPPLGSLCCWSEKFSVTTNAYSGCIVDFAIFY